MWQRCCKLLTVLYIAKTEQLPTIEKLSVGLITYKQFAIKLIERRLHVDTE